MKVKLLIATEDSDYSNFLSDVLSSKYRETIDPHTCSTEESLWESMKRNRYDIGLFSPKLAQDADLSQCGLSLLLWDEETDYSGIQDPRLEMIQKYQRISFLVEEVLKRYAKIAESRKGMKKKQRTYHGGLVASGRDRQNHRVVSLCCTMCSPGKQDLIFGPGVLLQQFGLFRRRWNEYQ